MPSYNPKGLYWVKLYFMGKPRKIVIDDKIPCNKNNDILFPRCENVDEMWPFILTKAIIKLFSYKFKSLIYSPQEIGDMHIIYALTGYIPEKIKLDKYIRDTDEIKTKLINYLNDNCFFNKKYHIMTYNQLDQNDLYNLENNKFSESSLKFKIKNASKTFMRDSYSNLIFGRPKTPKNISINFFNQNFLDELDEISINRPVISNDDHHSNISDLSNIDKQKHTSQQIVMKSNLLQGKKKPNYLNKFLAKKKEIEHCKEITHESMKLTEDMKIMKLNDDKNNKKNSNKNSKINNNEIDDTIGNRIKPKILDIFSDLKTSKIKLNTNPSYKNSKSRKTILNLFKVDSNISMFFKQPSIVINNPAEAENKNIKDNDHENEKLNSKILVGCLYPILEIFSNNNFNMKRLKYG